MVVFSFMLIRESANLSAVGDTCRSLLAGAGTLLLFKALPRLRHFWPSPPASCHSGCCHCWRVHSSDPILRCCCHFSRKPSSPR